MDEIKLLPVISQAAQNHPDKYIQAIASTIILIANELNYEPRLHETDVATDTIRRDTSQNETDENVASNDAGNDKLQRIRIVLEGWEKAAKMRPTGISLQWHQIAELIRIIDE